MADDDSPPPPPSSPPPSFTENGDTVQDTKPTFKSLQQILAKSHTMYTSNRPAPPPKPIRPLMPELEKDESPKLEHRTRERPRRKIRAPSRSALRERASSSSIDVFGTVPVQAVRGAPPTAANTLPVQTDAPSPPSPVSPPHSPPPSPPTSSLPSNFPSPPQPSSSPLPPQQSDTRVDFLSSKPVDKPTVRMPDRYTASRDSLKQDIKMNETAKNTSASKSLWQSSRAHHQSMSAPAQHQPLISVVPFKGTDISPPAGVQSSTATFTNRLKQIRERRAARKSPSPSALSPTHSSSSLPQYMGPLLESATEVHSSLPVSSMSASPVTSLASLDSSIQREGSTDPHSDRWSPSLQEISSRGRRKKQEKPIIDSSNLPSLPSSVTSSSPPSPPPLPPSFPPLTTSQTPSVPQSVTPSPPPSPPPPLPPSFPPITSSFTPSLSQSVHSSLPPPVPPSLTPSYENSLPAIPSPLPSQETSTRVVEGSRCLPAMKSGLDRNLSAHKSSESLSSSSDSAPELPSVPPPLALETTETTQPPTENERTPSIYLDSPPLLPDIAEGASITSDSSAPPSSISTPRMASGPVQLRHPQKPVGYRPERRSAFEAMLISESSSEGQKRLSVAERRVLTLQASRRSDAASQPVMKRWSDTSNIFSSLSPVENDRSKSALAMLGIGERGPVGLGANGAQSRKKHDITIPTRSGNNSAGNSGWLDSGDASNAAIERSNKGVIEGLTSTEEQTVAGYKHSRPVDGVYPASPENMKESRSPRYHKEPPTNHIGSPWEVKDGLKNAGEPALADRDGKHDMLEHSSDQLAIPKTDFYCRGGERGREEEGGREGMGERKGEDGRESDNDTWDDSDDLEDDPNTWSVDRVCEWLELVGLGTYRDTFRVNSVDGVTLLNMDVHLFAELGVDSPEIRELFLAKIYELSNPTRNVDDMQDDFCLEVDSYTEQDWKKLEAAVNALKSPVLQDDIELEPSAIGLFLHTDYAHSRSTPNIHQPQQQLAETHSDTELPSTDNLFPPVPHSSTVHSFPDYTPTSQAESTDQVRRKKSRVPSTRSVQRQCILSMAEAGDRPSRRQSGSNHTTRPSSSVSSRQGSPSLGSRHSAIELSTSPPHTKGAVTSKTGEGKKKRRSKMAEESSQSSAYGPMTAQLSKDLDQGVVVHEDGKYQRVRLGSYLKQTARHEMSSSKPSTDSTSGLVRLYMENVQEGLHYKAFLVEERTSAAELVDKALERSHIIDNPLHYCIWQVASANTELCRELAASECPLTLQLNWPQSNNNHFELRIKGNVQRVQFLLDLPLCPRTEVKLSLPTSASTAEAVQSILAVLGLGETFSQRGVHCALMDVTSRTRVERALAEKECPVTLLNTGHKLKLVSLSVQKRHSSGQSDVSLLARLQRLEQEKAMLTEQLQSAQSFMRSHMEAEQTRRRSTSTTTGPDPPTQQEKQKQLHSSVDRGAGDGAVGEAEEEVVERLRGLNSALNNQLEQQRENTTELTREKERLEKNVLELTSRDKEMVLEIGVLKATITGLKEQLSDSERSRKQSIDRSQPRNDVEISSLQESLRRAKQEITRLQNSNQEQAVKLEAAEQERLKTVRCVRQFVVQSGVGEDEDTEEESNSASVYRASQAELVKACRHAKKELRQHRLYLDQLLAIVIERHPEVLTMVTEAQNMRDLLDSESWC